MSDTTYLQSAQKHFEFIDALLALAQNWKKLFFLPLIMGLLGWYASQFLISKTYTSSSLLAGPRSTSESRFLTAAVLDELLGLAPDALATRDEKRKWISSKISATRIRQPNAKDDDTENFFIATKGNSPASAKSLGEALIASWQKTLPTSGTRRKILEARLRDLQFFNDAFKQQAIASTLRTPQPDEKVDKLFVDPVEIGKSIAEMQERLTGWQLSDVILSPPTLPDKGEEKIPFLGPILWWLSAIALGTWLVLGARNAHLNAQSAERAEKWEAIRQAFSFSP